MSDILRTLIEKNLDHLAHNTSSLQSLLNLLLEHGILQSSETQAIKSEPTEYERLTKLYLTVSKKGDDALPKFRECLKKSGNKHVLKCFKDDKDKTNARVTENNNDSPNQPLLPSTEDNEGDESLIGSVKHILCFGILIATLVFGIVIFVAIYELNTTHTTQTTSSVSPTDETKSYSTTTLSPSPSTSSTTGNTTSTSPNTNTPPTSTHPTTCPNFFIILFITFLWPAAVAFVLTICYVIKYNILR